MGQTRGKDQDHLAGGAHVSVVVAVVGPLSAEVLGFRGAGSGTKELRRQLAAPGDGRTRSHQVTKLPEKIRSKPDVLMEVAGEDDDEDVVVVVALHLLSRGPSERLFAARVTVRANLFSRELRPSLGICSFCRCNMFRFSDSHGAVFCPPRVLRSPRSCSRAPTS